MTMTLDPYEIPDEFRNIFFPLTENHDPEDLELKKQRMMHYSDRLYKIWGEIDLQGFSILLEGERHGLLDHQIRPAWKSLLKCLEFEVRDQELMDYIDARLYLLEIKLGNKF